MLIGDTIAARFEVTDLICEGGQATIAKALDRDTGHNVAIRHLTTMANAAHHAAEQARFLRAGHLRIGHPNVLDPQDIVEQAGEHYMILPLIDGATLDQHVARSGGRLSAEQAVAITRQIADGLAACHAVGVVHRDLKPANIMVEPNGHVWIIDFGICSKADEQTITKGDGLLGSLHWMAPEQIITPACRDDRLDLYALGCCFYFMLTGQAAAKGSTNEEVALNVCQTMPPSPRQVDPLIPEQVDQVCMRLLAKQPEKRFASAKAALAALSKSCCQDVNCCPSCSTPAAKATRYCHKCGALLIHGKEASVRCMACGSRAVDTRICSHCGRSFSAADHRITFSRGVLAGCEFRIPEGVYEVGRDALTSRDQHISRRHLGMMCVNGAAFIVDLGSANRTLVEGQSAEIPVLLQPRAEVAIAGNRGVYHKKKEVIQS